MNRVTHLNKPGLELVVNNDVIAVALKTVSVGSHDGGHSSQGVHQTPVDVPEEFVCPGLTTGAL